MDASCKIQRSIHDVRLTYKYVSRILGTYHFDFFRTVLPFLFYQHLCFMLLCFIQSFICPGQCIFRGNFFIPAHYKNTCRYSHIISVFTISIHASFSRSSEYPALAGLVDGSFCALIPFTG